MVCTCACTQRCTTVKIQICESTNRLRYQRQQTLTNKIVVIVPKGEKPVVLLIIPNLLQILFDAAKHYAADVPMLHILEAEDFLSHD